jgi:hypothetical protein
MGDDRHAPLENGSLHSSVRLLVWILVDQIRGKLNHLTHASMLILFVPFNIEIE